MRAPIRRMGNSAGIILPKPVLAELGVGAGDDLELRLERGRVVLMPAKARAGWAEAAAAIGASEDAPVWPEFGNDGDDELVW